MSRHENDPPRLIFAVLLGLGVIANPVQARAPSDGELQTAYCIPIVKGELEVAQRAVAAQEKSLAEINAAAGSSDMVKAAIEVLDNLRGEAARYRALLSRMQTYLLPGAGGMDPAALSTAENRGRADWQSLMAGRDGVDKDVARRTKSCNDPTWLPS